MKRNNDIISTIVLNWNRLQTLRITVESYLDTIGGGYELIVVDNASTDGSREYLEEIARAGKARVVLLPENIGGLAYNQVLDMTSGYLVHLSENDQLFLEGWSEHVRESFDVYEDLGQLSLFADVPTDYEAWGPKPSKIRIKRGKILYEAQYNLTTSAICRAEVFFEKGVRVTNLEGLDYKFPADGQLSADIKAVGYWCAWSDRYYVRNLGHEVEEFEASPDYYQGNYASKPWVGVDGWRERIDKQRAQPKFKRASTVFSDRIAVPEKTEAAVRTLAARSWSMFDTVTPEVETLDFIYSLIRLTKPIRVIETRAWIGLTAVAVAYAMRDNGVGSIVAIERDPDLAQTAQKHADQYGVSSLITVASMDFGDAEGPFDLAILDVGDEHLTDAASQLIEQLSDGAIVIVPRQLNSVVDIGNLLKAFRISGLDLPTPRGLFVGRLCRKPITPVDNGI